MSVNGVWQQYDYIIVLFKLFKVMLDWNSVFKPTTINHLYMYTTGAAPGEMLFYMNGQKYIWQRLYTWWLLPSL